MYVHLSKSGLFKVKANCMIKGICKSRKKGREDSKKCVWLPHCI